MQSQRESAFYSTSNKIYGWRNEDGDVNAPERIRAIKERDGRTEEDKAFNKLFWQSSNHAYGAFGFHKNTLCRAVDDLDTVTRAKHVVKYNDGPTPPNEAKREMDIEFGEYELKRKVEHQIYTTSSNEIGAKKPPFDAKIFPHTSDFTKTFQAGMQRDCALNTTISPPRFVEGG